jgi:2'-5' RNA ligase
METAEEQPGPISISSYQTALCLVPPQHLWPSIDRLRALYDGAYQKWPPHVNLIYPFVRLESVDRAADLIAASLASHKQQSSPLVVRLDSPGIFTQRQVNTVFLKDDDRSRLLALAQVRTLVLEALGQVQNATPYNMHMTVAQTEDIMSSKHKFIVEKVRLVPSVEWRVSELHLLVRESGKMRLWGTIDLLSSKVSRPSQTAGPPCQFGLDAEMADEEVRPHSTCQFSGADGTWKSLPANTQPAISYPMPKAVTVSSYNVLAEFNWPPNRVRYPIVIENILAQPALADMLVLIEITDDFLPHLLRHEDIRTRYPFATHGPPDQADIGPLPTHLNIVVLSRFPFRWSFLPLKRRFKGSLILTFDGIEAPGERGATHPLILAACHLTQGLTDLAVATKRNELQRILGHLRAIFPDNPWILAGDFNISTSSYTIDTAVRKKGISAQTAAYLPGLDVMLAEAGLLDSWMVARVEAGESIRNTSWKSISECFEGEQGATFDPTENSLAQEIVGSGFNNRPQRYDRILVKGGSLLHIAAFNMFGLRTSDVPEGLEKTTSLFGSDHWGVRCVLKVEAGGGVDSPNDSGKNGVVRVERKAAPPHLSDTMSLKECLRQHGITPSEEDEVRRRQVLVALEDILYKASHRGSNAISAGSRVSLVLVPVGSYGLGVWTKSSDMDCLCIGNLRSKTFFDLVMPRLRKAHSDDVKVLRLVKANSGTMVELEVKGVKVDLQYCPATYIAQT